MAIKVYPYRQGSASARALADVLGGRVLRLEGSRYRPRPNDLVINWGSSSHPFDLGDRFLNFGGSVAIASNKLESFNAFQDAGVSIPRFWTNREDIPDDAFPVVCRTILRGHSGAGIVMADTRGDLVQAPLYVEYVKKQDEYRVHVVRGEVVAVQRKARDTSNTDPNWRVRNHANGFVFVREGVNPPECVVEQALRAIEALGLDFGGVDVIFNARHERAYVLECNTACGLQGQTIEDYAGAFRRIAGNG